MQSPRSPRTYESIGFALLLFLFWSSIVCFEAFMVPYLRFRGYTPAQIGPIMGAVFGFAVIGQPALGSISDRIRSRKYLVVPALLLAGGAVSLIPVVDEIRGAILAIALVFSLTANSLPAVLDAWIMERRDANRHINYGFIRGIGSAGFAVGAVVFGFATERFGPAIVFPAFLGLTVAAATIVIGMPRTDARNDDPQTGASRLREGLAAILANREYLALLVSAFLAFAGLRAALTYLPLLIESLDGSLTDVGFAHSVAAISEIPIFFLATRILRRIHGRKLISAVLTLLALRLYAYTWLTAAPQVLLLQISHGVTFGVFLLAAVDYIHRIAPPAHRGLFQSLAPAIYFSLGSIVGSWLGGIVIESFSIVVLYRGAAALALIGAPLPLLAGRKIRS